MAKIGFLGTGKMGQGMVRRLLGAGHSVTAYNRTLSKARALEKAGARLAPTPRLAAEGADAVFAIVDDDEASRVVWYGPEAALSATPAPGAFAIECSTLSYDWVTELDLRAREKGWRFLDCPVAGRPDAAASGQLSVFVGASDEDLITAHRLLEPFSKTITHFGPVGTGTIFKLIYNLMSTVQVASLAEALAVAEAAGLDGKVVARALATGAAGSPHVVRHAAYMSEGKHPKPVAFSGRGRLKDSRYATAFATKLGVPVALGEAAIALFGAMVERGMGERNDSEVIDALRAMRKSARTP